MELEKGMEHTIILMVVNIKDSGRIRKEKGMEYTHVIMDL